MHRLLRFVLLAMGCVVMVATSSSRDFTLPSSIRVELSPGVPQSFAVSATSRGKATSLVPQIHMGGQSLSGGSHGRVVVFVSEGFGDAAEGVDLNGPFTVGQEVEGLGTVAFISDVPFTTRGEDGKGRPWVLPEARGYVVNVLAQNATIALDMQMAIDDMASACQCSVNAGFDGAYEYYPSPPDGGVGDGGVGDGG